MDFPVQSIVEQAIKNQTNALVGTSDINLNTIVKMSLMSEKSQLKEDIVKEVLIKIYDANKDEDYWVHKEYELTYDMSGNIVPCNSLLSIPNINGETEKNSNSVNDEPKRSKGKLE